MGTKLMEDRVAIVTGGGRGIGRRFAEALTAEGARVAVCDVDGDAARDVAKALGAEGPGAIDIEMDHTDAAAVEAMATRVRSEFGRIDALVNNAGLFSTLQRGSALDINRDEWSRVMEINVVGPALCCTAVLPTMVEQGAGKIVNIASSSIFAARNRLPHYVASKAGVVGLTRALAREFGEAGIQVNALSPGATASGGSSREYLQSKVGDRAIPRVQETDDLVGALLFLSSWMSDFMTGQHIVVDGGAVFH